MLKVSAHHLQQSQKVKSSLVSGFELNNQAEVVVIKKGFEISVFKVQVVDYHERGSVVLHSRC